MSYGISVLIAFDQLFNALLSGSPDETISSRAYRCGVLDKAPKKRWVVARWVIDGIFYWQKVHCQQAYDSERMRKHMPSVFDGLH